MTEISIYRELLTGKQTIKTLETHICASLLLYINHKRDLKDDTTRLL